MKNINLSLLKKTALTLGCIGSITPILAKEKPSKNPNIILIVVDDIGYGDFACYGNKFNKTPNIDYLAKHGLKFTDFHSNGAVSSPTRCALMTGSYQQRSGIGWVITASKGREDGIDPNKNTIAKLLRNNGYDTAMFGKWHLGYPEKHNPIHLGFNHFVGYVSGNVDYFTHIDGAGHPDWWHNNKLQEENGYTTTLITDYSEKYLKQKHDKPFFLYVPFEACHSPWQGPNDKAIKGIVDGKCKYFHKPQRDPKVIYKDMIEYLDVCVGRIIKTVKTQGLLDNTMIVLFSDNGGSINSCNAPLSGKKDMVLEGGHRVPAIVYWPNKVKPGISNETIMSMDILPSVCKLTHTKYHKKNFDGKNFLPVIFKNKKMPSRTIFIKNKLVVSARKDNWKLMINEETGEKILIDLNTDLIEKNNLANKYPKKVKKLTKEIKKWEKSWANVKQIS